MNPTAGLHHVTAIASDGNANIAFYQNLLGMRLVKKTVNFDVPDTYHLYYGNEAGEPGTALTFFLWPHLPQARPGHGVTHLTRLAVTPGSLDAWAERFQHHNLPVRRETRFGEEILSFQDPDGMTLALTGRDLGATTDSEALKVLGFDGVELQVQEPEATRNLLLAMGYSEYALDGGRERLKAGGKAELGQYVDLHITPDAPPARQGLGAVHHIAFRAVDAGHQSDFHQLATRMGHTPSPVMDRTYFQSIYFREPNGILFEVATDQPGFTVDEPLETLGQALKLPPPLESHRAKIEASLPTLH